MNIKTKLLSIIFILLAIVLVVSYFNSRDSKLPDNHQVVNFYYYSPELDLDEQGNIACSEKGLVVLERFMPISDSIIEDSLKMFLNTPLSKKELAAGLISEVPMSGVTLLSADLNEGHLSVVLSGGEQMASGGACRASILKAQLETMVKQFSEVKTFNFQPTQLFEP